MGLMREMDKNKKVFQNLGKRLKYLRQKRNASLLDVSGAVEIDTKELESIENGDVRPSEDILLLLASYFELKDNEASTLWELAGYDPKPQDSAPNLQEMIPEAVKSAMLILPVDNRVVYSDMVQVSANQYGIVMSFMQRGSEDGQSATVSRVGMSKEHAKSVLELLQKTLYRIEPKKLPGQNTQKKQK